MQPQLSIVLDTRRKKNNSLYPLKLRVYFKSKTVRYQTIYDLSKDDFDKLDSKRISANLANIKEKIGDIEFKAITATKKISPFDFEKFYDTFIRDNDVFNVRIKPSKTESVTHVPANDIPVEWKKKFTIFKELHPGPDYISTVYQAIIKSLLYQARIGTAENYLTSYNSLKAFRGNVRVSEITPQLLKEYEGWMINDRGNSKTTVGIYTRVIRAVINEAIEQKLMSRDDYPFGRRRYGIPTGRNIKKAMDKVSISKLYYTEIESKEQQKAKDFWFFSFYGNGMNVKDIICLKYKNIKGEFLVFERAKTELTTRGREPIVISCFLNQDMLDIIERWGNKNNDPENYIFPILKPGLSPIRQFEIKKNFNDFINKHMIKVSEKAAIEKKCI
ncbi:MAG: phage integrase SAM-like domain-containing protein [Ferruginibacter sp.]